MWFQDLTKSYDNHHIISFNNHDNSNFESRHLIYHYFWGWNVIFFSNIKLPINRIDLISISFSSIFMNFHLIPLQLQQSTTIVVLKFFLIIFLSFSYLFTSNYLVLPLLPCSTILHHGNLKGGWGKKIMEALWGISQSFHYWGWDLIIMALLIRRTLNQNYPFILVFYILLTSNSSWSITYPLICLWYCSSLIGFGFDMVWV